MAKKKKRKAKRKNILIFTLTVIILTLILVYTYNLKITNITVKGNTLLTEKEIIEQAGLENYPSSMENLSAIIKERLEKNPYIEKANVKKHLITNVEITITENTPLFYYVPNKKTVLKDKKETDDTFPVPTLINYVPNKIYNKFLKAMGKVDNTIIKRISEIKYDPNDVDEERFLLTMTDGNYVYLTLSKFNKINSYLNIVKEFNNKKGILYLDSGEYFKVIQ